MRIAALLLAVAATQAAAQDVASDLVDTARCIGAFEGRDKAPGPDTAHIVPDPGLATRYAQAFDLLAAGATPDGRAALQAARAGGRQSAMAEADPFASVEELMRQPGLDPECIDLFRQQGLMTVLFPG